MGNTYGQEKRNFPTLWAGKEFLEEKEAISVGNTFVLFC